MILTPVMRVSYLFPPPPAVGSAAEIMSRPSPAPGSYSQLPADKKRNRCGREGADCSTGRATKYRYLINCLAWHFFPPPFQTPFWALLRVGKKGERVSGCGGDGECIVNRLRTAEREGKEGGEKGRGGGSGRLNTVLLGGFFEGAACQIACYTAVPPPPASRWTNPLKSHPATRKKKKKKAYSTRNRNLLVPLSLPIHNKK